MPSPASTPACRLPRRRWSGGGLLTGAFGSAPKGEWPVSTTSNLQIGMTSFARTWKPCREPPDEWPGCEFLLQLQRAALHDPLMFGQPDPRAQGRLRRQVRQPGPDRLGRPLGRSSTNFCSSGGTARRESRYAALTRKAKNRDFGRLMLPSRPDAVRPAFRLQSRTNSRAETGR